MDYNKLLDESGLPDGTLTKTKKFALSSKSIRQNVIQTTPGTEEAMICAAIEIQRVYRGYCTRCRILYILDPTSSKTAIYGDSKHELARLREIRSPSPKEHSLHDMKSSTSTLSSRKNRLEQYYQSYVSRMIENGSVPNTGEIMPFEDFCATYIQDWWGQMKHKREEKERGVSKPQTPSKVAQGAVKVVPKKRLVPLNEIEASTVIQRAWRKHIDVQVYRYYRDLINFRSKGDPGMMLRCINPNEAKYLDAASGIHVKFRLAGERFPPNIYYKIFTHRPIQDLCANSPKDYTNATTKRLGARDVHNKGNRAPQIQGQQGWYERSENNGWRLVSDRLIHHIMSDPVTWDTSKKKIEFHHNKLQRRQDVEKKKKQKKIDWMKKMYKDGMLHAKVDEKETVNLIEGAAAGMVATVDAHGPDAVQDWEVDELLDWTTGLNFDDYLNTWKELATSSLSEKQVEERFRLNITDSDPFEISISQNNTRKKSASTTKQSQSHNTPVSSGSAVSVNY